jgi:hypothetical protein
VKYLGDRTGHYDHGRGTGLVGKVVGPNVNGQWFVVVGASYDDETDTTHVEVEPILDPATMLDRKAQ